MDAIIILTAKILGWLVLVAITLGVISVCSAIAWRVYRNAIGWPLVTEAIRAYRKAHPEKFRRFDKASLNNFDE